MSGEFLAIAVVLALLSALLIGIPVWQQRRGRLGIAGFAALVIITPLAVLSLYTQVSTYPWEQPELVSAPPQGSPEQILEMVAELAFRMQEEPTVEGLSMLARSYRTLERFEEAVDAWDRAWVLSEGQDPLVSISYAEALIIVDRDTLLTSAGDLLEAAILQAPYEPRALWYGALSRIAKGDNATAEARLVQLLENPDIPDQLRMVVQQQLAAIGGQPPAQAAAEPEETGPAITVTIAIADALELPERGVLYVFAREAGVQGAPIAVKRVPATRFPAEIVLTDADAMVAGRKLADAAALEITARISATGNAIASAGDLFGTATPEWAGADISLDLLIDSVVSE